LTDTVESLKVRITELESENAKLKTSSVKDIVSQPAGNVEDIPRTNTNPIRLQKPVKYKPKLKLDGGEQYGEQFQ